MKRRLCSAILTVFALVLFATQVGAAVTDIVPPWPETAGVFVLHLDNPDSLLSRVESSHLFQSATQFVPEMALLSEIMKGIPIKGVTVAVKIAEEDVEALCGAVQFSGDKRAVLDTLAAGKGTTSDLDALLGLPVEGTAELELVEGSIYSLTGEGLPPLTVAPEGDMLLFGGSTEDLTQARDALADETKRMTVPRGLPQASYLYFRDNGLVGAQIQEESGGYLRATGEKLFLEVGFDPADDGYHLSFFTNMTTAFVGREGASDPVHPAALAQEDQLLIGSGTPWLTMLGRVILHASDLQAVRDATAADEDLKDAAQVLDMAKSFGIDDNALISILRSVGLVMGGKTTVMGMPLQGGYLHVSGEKKDVELLIPIMEKVVADMGLPFQREEVPGWTILYAIREPVGAIMGIRGNTVVLGAIDPDALAASPTLSPKMANLYGDEKLLAFLNLDGRELRGILLSLLDPDGPWSGLIAEQAGSEIPLLMEVLKSVVEFEAFEIRCDSMERFHLSLYTAPADQGELDAITAMAEKWSTKNP